jgi:hypothetical protein
MGGQGSPVKGLGRTMSKCTAFPASEQISKMRWLLCCLISSRAVEGAAAVRGAKLTMETCPWVLVGIIS